jgi:uncharacterized protein (TIGR02145 family)
MKRIIIFINSIILLTLFLVSISYAQNSGTFTDPRDSKTYKWVKIGSQIWMAENLDYAVGYGSAKYGNSYGRMYNWETSKEVCPSGWHLPSDAEWKQLEKTIGVSASQINEDFRSCDNDAAGLKLKSKNGWEFYVQNGNGIDTYGFNALPGGYYQPADNKFMLYGVTAYFWTSTSSNDSEAFFRELRSLNNCIDRMSDPKVLGMYVRCVRD